MIWTPMDFSAAMFAREGTSEGRYEWCGPWRATNAMWTPEGSEKMLMADEGVPHGLRRASERHRCRQLAAHRLRCHFLAGTARQSRR